MTSRKITSTLGTVQTSIESAWNRIVMGVRTRKMPKTIKRVKQTFSKGGKQSGLSSNWEESYRERQADLLNKTTFYPKYMGSTLVEELVDPEPGANYYNTGLSTKALDRIIRMSRNKSLVSVSITICSRGIQVIKLSDRTILIDVPMERVSFSANDKKYSKVTAFIAKNYVNETMECYAFLCDKQRMAKAIADALSSAFVQSKRNTQHHSDPTTETSTAGLITEHSKRDNSTSDIYNQPDSIIDMVPAAETLVDCENNEKFPQVQLREKNRNETNNLASEENHNLLLLTDTCTSTNNHQRHTTTDLLVDDSDLEPVVRARADSDTFAVLNTVANDNSNTDLELEFSNFARSRSTTNLADLHTSIHFAWDV